MKMIILLIFFLIASICCTAQAGKTRNFSGGRFDLVLDGSKGFLKPVEKGDTLTYSLVKLSDSTRARKLFDSLNGQIGKRYFLKFKSKNP